MVIEFCRAATASRTLPDTHDQLLLLTYVRPGVQIWTPASDQRKRFYRLRYSHEDKFVECRIGPKASHVRLTYSETVPRQDAATLLLHPILGCVLRIRQVVCLHATAVAHDDGCFALLGPSASGKSTTAAVLASWGYPILADDVVALVEVKNAFWVQPGIPRLRLHLDSANAVFGDGDSLPGVWCQDTDRSDKLLVDSVDHGAVPAQALPLSAIYYLQPRDEGRKQPRIAPLAAPDQLLCLLQNTFASYLLDPAGRAHEFSVLARLAQTVTVCSVCRPKGLDALEMTCESILADLAAIRKSTASTDGPQSPRSPGHSSTGSASESGKGQERVSRAG